MDKHETTILIELAHPGTGQILTYSLSPKQLERAIKAGFTPVDATTEHVETSTPQSRVERILHRAQQARLRREAKREQRWDRFFAYVAKRPAISIYVMTVVSVIYLTWQTAPMLRDPAARWVAILFMLPMVIGVAALGRLTGKMITLTAKMDERDRAAKQAELDAKIQTQMDDAERQLDEMKLKQEVMAKLREEHESEDCPGPSWDPPEETLHQAWTCGTCATVWVWQGQWTAP